MEPNHEPPQSMYSSRDEWSLPVTRYRRPADQARQTLTDATTVATLIDAALVNLDQALTGWPTQTPGASPLAAAGSVECPHPDCARTRPCPEHDDSTTPGDSALRDLEALTLAVRLTAHHAAQAARLASRWGLTRLTLEATSSALQERLDEIWCTNCARHGITTVRRTGRQECTFCESFRTQGTCGLHNPNGYPATKALLDIKFSRRLNSADVIRAMTPTYGPDWNRKVSKKKGRAA